MHRESVSASSKKISAKKKEASRNQNVKRTQILQSMGVKEFFEEGNISIDKKTCKGIECQLCIKACPTNALYWKYKSGEVSIIQELCIFCAACVANCIVDNCVRVSRKRTDGKTERLSTPANVFTVLNDVNSGKRIKFVKTMFFDV